MPNENPSFEDVMEVVNTIRPLLQGKGPAVQGAALAELLATFLAGHHPQLREEILTIHMATVRRLIGPNEALIFGRLGGKPPGWDDPAG